MAAENVHSFGGVFSAFAEVFDPRVRPWVNMDGAETTQIIEQVKNCPSGALSFLLNSDAQMP